jgi:hypothetical protein
MKHCTAVFAALVAAAFMAMLASRSFQAGAKLLLATGSALVLTILLMVYDVRVRRWGHARGLAAWLITAAHVCSTSCACLLVIYISGGFLATSLCKPCIP